MTSQLIGKIFLGQSLLKLLELFYFWSSLFFIQIMTDSND